MPRYINRFTSPIYFDHTVFIPNQEVETLNVIDNQAFIVSTQNEPYNIGVLNNTLLIRFNNDLLWTTVTLTSGAARTATEIVDDINTAYGSDVAVDEGGYVRLVAPVNSTLSAVYIATTGSTAAATLGFVTDDNNPVDLVAMQVFRFSSLAEPHNITTTNNTFIFKFNNNPNWITATLTTGAARTAVQIAAELNFAYETATADATKIAFAVEPTTGAGFHIKLVSPIYNNFESKLYIKSTGNTALSVLGFTGHDFDPIVRSLFPSVVKTAELPLYNPIISETPLVFPAAGTYYYYLTDPDGCKYLTFFRIQGVGGLLFTCYIENIANTPPFTLTTNEIMTINLSGKRVSRIIIMANVAGDLTIRERIG